MPDSRFTSFGGVVIPSQIRVTTRTAAPQVIAAADTTLLTLAALDVANNPVIIEATVELLGAVGDEVVTFKLFRDGAELVAADRYQVTVENPDLVTVTIHFADETPGATTRVYSIVAIGATGNVTANNRRATAHTS